METLKIIIKGEYFDMIKSGENKIEYREVTPFWTSRLFDKEGKKRSYDSVLFINGYNKDARRLTTEFKGVTIKNGVYNINLGKIIK